MITNIHVDWQGGQIPQLVKQWAMVWMAEESGFDSPQGQEIFMFSTVS
jgi:hypothetical protein